MIQKDKLTNEALGVMATMSPSIAGNTSSRLAMAAHHQGQAICPEFPDINRYMVGFEKQLPTFDVVMPVNGLIVGIIKKFPRELGEGAIHTNPLITLIFQCQDTGMYDTLDITTYHSKHRVYGTSYVILPIVNQLRVNHSYVSKGTILARNMAKQYGVFTNGLSVSTANIAMPCTIEDGYGVSESFCNRGALLELPSVTGTWGRDRYPRNLYGKKKYQPFPNIGERVRDDGILFAFCEYDPMFDALEMSESALNCNEIDKVNDILIYAPPGAIVYDIIALSGLGETKSKMQTPAPMAEQAERYINYDRSYYDNILNVYENIQRTNHTKKLNLSPKLIVLIHRAFGDKPNQRKFDKGTLIRRTVDDIPIDEFQVEIKLHHRRVLAPGSKITGQGHGNKGVICKIFPDHERPLDSLGNPIDVVKFLKANVARMNAGLTYDQYEGAAARDLTFWVRENIGVLDFSVIWDRVFALYSAIAHTMAERISKRFTEQDKVNHINDIIANGIYLIIPPDTVTLGLERYDALNAVITPLNDVVSYVNSAGRRVTTKDRVFVGVEQMIILEKSDQNPMAISSGQRQVHGLLAGPNKSMRNRHPTKQQAVKSFSESEVRAWSAFFGPHIMAMMLTMSNSPEAHQMVIIALLNTSSPSRLGKMPRLPKNTSRPLKYVNNLFTVFGLTIRNR
jgi:hypothetical protein